MSTRVFTVLFLTGCMSSSTTIEPSNTELPTAGSSADTGMQDGIFGLHDSSTPWEDADGGLVMLSEDSGTDAQEPLDASTDAIIDSPDAGHDAAVPELSKTCDLCTTDADCAMGYACQFRSVDSITECFLRTDTLPMGTSCYDLEPTGHLIENSEEACVPYLPFGNGGPCETWQAAWAGKTAY